VNDSKILIVGLTCRVQNIIKKYFVIKKVAIVFFSPDNYL
jgi:hypothetical protein